MSIPNASDVDETPKMFNLDDVAKCFPFDEPREGQLDAIAFAANAFNSGKDVVIIEAPTGIGKSAIAYTLMEMVNRSYYLTVTKILQDQLVSEFGDELIELRGRANYPCTWWDRHGRALVQKQIMSNDHLQNILDDEPNCAEGYCRTTCPTSEQISQYKCKKCFLRSDSSDKKSGSLDALPTGMVYSACPYYEQVYTASASRKVVMNFSAFLYQTTTTNRFNDVRDLICLDECHSVEQLLLDFISMTLDDRQLQAMKITLPRFETAAEYAIWFAENNIEDALARLYNECNGELERGDLDVKARQATIKKLDDLSRVNRKFREFMRHMYGDRPSEWVVDVEHITVHDRSWTKLVFKPVLVHDFIYQLLFSKAKKVLMMSATVLDVKVMCDALGINRDRIATYRMKNRFPVESRPIYVEPCARISGGASKMREWAPYLVEKVNELMRKHPDVKGIIHTHNFAISDLLMEKCDEDVSCRFAYQKRFRDKSDLLEHHGNTPRSVIVAPAMYEGIDLRDDLSRLQIIAKVPFPNYHEDKQLARRMQIDGRYYDWLTALRLVQSYGRSIRSKDDWADTYIIDETFEFFLKKTKKMLPGWFLEALRYP